MTTDAILPFAVPPVVKSVVFRGQPERAFDRLTLDIGQWWPLGTHSLGEDPNATLAFESLAPGARLIETLADGTAHVWGSVIESDPPSRLVFTWHVGRSPDLAQTIEVRFQPVDLDRTRVTLTHSGWERLGQAGAAMRENYDNGWVVVLARFVG
jgi:uncharacterized protein YndB with AHSA1/START domain